MSQWDAPGSATLAQTKAVVKKWAAALTAEKIPGAGLYAKDATFDYWAGGEIHDQGVTAIEDTYRVAAVTFDWAKGHLLVGPGVVAYEGKLTAYGDGTATFPALGLARRGRQEDHS